MEAGMGGRLDATNAAKQVLLSVITPVAHDHEEYLGTSLRSIGMEKFAVVRPETPALYSGEPPELEDLFLERCSLAKAEPHVFRRIWCVEHPVVEEEGCSYELFGPGFDEKCSEHLSWEGIRSTTARSLPPGPLSLHNAYRNHVFHHSGRSQGDKLAGKRRIAARISSDSP
jgi:folylpolyglutamate synthase/dihydropteroate synthase